MTEAMERLRRRMHAKSKLERKDVISVVEAMVLALMLVEQTACAEHAGEDADVIISGGAYKAVQKALDLVDGSE